jgi:hypothetical protein
MSFADDFGCNGFLITCLKGTVSRNISFFYQVGPEIRTFYVPIVVFICKFCLVSLKSNESFSFALA